MTTERQIIRATDLPDLRRVGGRYRASCPIHGSDHQRSLSIQPEGEYAGFGKCFACGAEVVVQEMNPEAAQRLQTLGARPLIAERLLRPVTRYHVEAAPWQQQEVAALQALEPRLRAALARSERARAYLAARSIPLEVAEAAGVGYMPPAWQDRAELEYLQKWVDRVIFPLSSPDGRGYAGRALARWYPGMDENEHKRLLDQPGAPERWRKTYPAGWQGLAELSPTGEQVIIVEGPFDRLALLVAGVPATNVVALVGSRDSRAADWLPARIRRAMIALDGDTKGREAAEALRQALYLAGLVVTICTPPDDDMGKDWSERLRLGGQAGLSPVLEAERAPVEAAAAVLLPWCAAWDALDYRERLYKMAEVLGSPSWEGVAAGDWRGWYAFKDRADAVQIAAAYAALRLRFEL